VSPTEIKELRRLLSDYKGGVWCIANEHVLQYWERRLYKLMWEEVNQS